MSVYIYVYMHIYVCTCMHTYIKLLNTHILNVTLMYEHAKGSQNDKLLFKYLFRNTLF